MILGIGGVLGGGKGTVVDYLKEKYGFAHYSSSDLLIQILEERGEEVNREGTNRVANELRAENPGGVPVRNFARYEAEDGVSDVIFESLHSVLEVEFIKSVGGIVLGVTADSDIRYDRILARGSVKDNVSKEVFMAQQKREEEGSEDPNTSNIFSVLKQTDFVIENNGTLEDLKTQVDGIMAELGFGSK